MSTLIVDALQGLADPAYTLLPTGVCDPACLDFEMINGALRLTIKKNSLDGSFFSGDFIPDGSITSSKIANGAVGTNQLADGAVTTSKLADHCVTQIKLALGAVTNTEIASGTILSSNLAPNSVVTNTINNAAVTNPPPFASGTQANLYATILNYADVLFPNFEPTTAPILTKIAAGHSGVTYTATDVTNITNWLTAEKTARAGSTSTTSPRDALLAKFSGCMTQTDFDSAGVATAWANKTTNTTNTACQQCHVNASYFLANADSTRMFQILSTAANPQGGWFMEYFFTVDTTDPTNLKMVINRDYINQAATGLDQHEKFDIDTDKNGGTPSAYTRLTTFFNAAMAKMTAGTCGTPTLGTTPP